MMRGDRSGYPPIVGMGGINYRSDAMDTVGIDLAGGARAAVQHLLDVGCCRIAYVAERMPDAGGEARHDSYTRVVERAGQPTEVILTGTQFRADVRRRLRDYLGEHGCPDGLFCTNDEVALGAYRALCDLGIRVPDDVALVGCDGIEDTEYLERPLTTIVQPVDQMCALAWQFLQRRIDDPSLPWQHALLAPQLVIRDSSRR
jgi:LacI family transcriptional regulator